MKTHQISAGYIAPERWRFGRGSNQPPSLPLPPTPQGVDWNTVTHRCFLVSFERYLPGNTVEVQDVHHDSYPTAPLTCAGSNCQLLKDP